MSEPTETQTVAQASEFLKQWPSLVPAIQRLVKASVAEATKCQPEVSRAAKAVADGVALYRVSGSSETFDRSALALEVQRAMDAAVTEERQRYLLSMNRIHKGDKAIVEVAGLTEELAEEREKFSRLHDRNNEWMKRAVEAEEQLAAAQSALAAMTSERDRLRDTKWEGITKLESALAEKEVALVLFAETHQQANKLANERGVQLSTERAARERAESAVVATRADRDRWEESWQKDTGSLRAQLQQAEHERDEARRVIGQLHGEAQAALVVERDFLRAELTATKNRLEEERAVSGLEKLIAERDSLTARNAELVTAFTSAMATVNAYCGHRYSRPDSELSKLNKLLTDINQSPE